MNSSAISVLCLWAAAALSGCARPHILTSPIVANNYTGSVTVVERDAGRLGVAHDTAYNTMSRILRSLDSREPRSDITRINEIAGSARWPIASDTFRILDLINHYARETDGAVDMTLSPIADLWGINGGAPPEVAPAQDLISAAMKGVGQHNVKLSDDETVAFYSPLTRLDLGEMAVGYAVDLSIVNLRRQGLTNVLVRLGGTTRCLGSGPAPAAWTVAVPDPWNATHPIGTVSLPRGAALAVKRLNERTITIGDQTYSHILDPRTGRPADGTIEVAVIGPSATMANALAQVLIVVGLERAGEMIARFPRCDALVIPDRQPIEIWATERFAKLFTPDPAFASMLQTLMPETLPEEPAKADAGG